MYLEDTSSTVSLSKHVINIEKRKKILRYLFDLLIACKIIARCLHVPTDNELVRQMALRIYGRIVGFRWKKLFLQTNVR